MKLLTQLPRHVEYHLTDNMLKLFPNLEVLTAYNGVSDVGLKRLNCLKHLSLRYNNRITGKGLSYIDNLYSLDLTGNVTINNNMLGTVSGLRRLNLTRNPIIRDNGLKYVPRLLDLIIMENNHITDRGLLRLSKLRKLDISDSNITDRGLKKLSLTYLRAAGNTNVTGKYIDNMSSLEKLDISYNNNVFDIDLPNLRVLHLKYNQTITNSVVVRHTNLEEIDISGSAVNAFALLALPKLKNVIMEYDKNWMD